MVVSDMVTSMGQIDLSENFLDQMGILDVIYPCQKKFSHIVFYTVSWQQKFVD